MSISNPGITLAIILLTLCQEVYGQDKPIQPQQGIIEFKLERNKIILPVSVNQSEPASIILDSGMPWNGLFLFHRGFIESMDLDVDGRASVGGAGNGEASASFVSDSVTIKAGNLEFNNQLVVVSNSETTQDFPTDGVIGWTIFSHPAVGINFDNKLLVLSEKIPCLDKSWKEIPVELNSSNIPFLKIKIVSSEGDDQVELNTYIDLAASENAELLVKDNSKFILPGNNETTTLGQGLSGNITGSKGRIYLLEIGGFVINNLPVNFPSAESRSRQGESAEAIIGCGLLRMFNIWFDYPASKIYIRPNSLFTDNPEN